MPVKAIWKLSAGIIPGVADPQYSHSWFYMREDYEADAAAATFDLAEPGIVDNRFTRMEKEVAEYQRQVTDPRTVNWVFCTFMWI